MLRITVIIILLQIFSGCVQFASSNGSLGPEPKKVAKISMDQAQAENTISKNVVIHTDKIIENSDKVAKPLNPQQGVVVAQNLTTQPNKTKATPTNREDPKQPKPVVEPSQETNNDAKNVINAIKPVNSTANVVKPKSTQDAMESGALLRGFYVFLGLSTITMFYFVFRSYRLRHGSQPSTTVRKYGVTARRSDVEMRRLELEEDEDDTLFEIGNLHGNNY